MRPSDELRAALDAALRRHAEATGQRVTRLEYRPDEGRVIVECAQGEPESVDEGEAGAFDWSEAKAPIASGVAGTKITMREVTDEDVDLIDMDEWTPVEFTRATSPVVVDHRNVESSGNVTDCVTFNVQAPYAPIRRKREYGSPPVEIANQYTTAAQCGTRLDGVANRFDPDRPITAGDKVLIQTPRGYNFGKEDVVAWVATEPSAITGMIDTDVDMGGGRVACEWAANLIRIPATVTAEGAEDLRLPGKALEACGGHWVIAVRVGDVTYRVEQLVAASEQRGEVLIFRGEGMIDIVRGRVEFIGPTDEQRRAWLREHGA